MPPHDIYHGFYHATLSIQLHIVVAVLLYALMLIICGLALAIQQQDKVLKSGRIIPWLHYLPSLETNEKLLIILLWVVWMALSVTMLSGAVFMQDMWQQKLSHKVFFTLASWLVISFMLINHQITGWRGRKLLYALVLAMFLILLGYFGTKIALWLIARI